MKDFVDSTFHDGAEALNYFQTALLAVGVSFAFDSANSLPALGKFLYEINFAGYQFSVALVSFRESDGKFSFSVVT